MPVCTYQFAHTSLHKLCANCYVQTAMCKLPCANCYVQTAMCKLVVQNDKIACNFLNNGPILINFFCLKAPNLFFPTPWALVQLHERSWSSKSARGVLCANWYVQTAMCKLLFANCYVQTAMCKLLCANCYVQTGILVCANWYVQTGMCKLVCANWYTGMCKLVCANWYVQSAMCKVLCAKCYVQTAMCELVVQNDIFACNFLNNGLILIIFFVWKLLISSFQLHEHLCNSMSALGASRALVECYVQTAMCKLLCANCYVQTAMCKLVGGSFRVILVVDWWFLPKILGPWWGPTKAISGRH